MPAFISTPFLYYGRRPNQFFEHELLAMLCPQETCGNDKRRCRLAPGVAHDSKTHSFSLRKSEDDQVITLDSTIRLGETPYRTELQARRIDDKSFEITHLVFDNRQERLDKRQEIYNVLAHIGRKQLLVTAEGGMAEPHQEKGQFGKFGRFLNRMIPDDPGMIPAF